jgi:hypothetical protein
MKSACSVLWSISAFALAALLPGCANIQAPLPPALELPRPPNDVRAVRKGDRVYLFWSVPTQTMDRQSIRRPGPTRICRSLESPMNACGTIVGNLPLVTNSGNQKPGTITIRPEASFVDTLPPELEQRNPNRMATYAVEALNREARSAGLSNRVQVPLAPTLPPPANFRADVTASGVALSWTWTPPPSLPPGIHSQCRFYRKSLDSGTETMLADLDCGAQQFRDPTAEWQKHYEYRATTLTSITTETTGPCAAHSSEPAAGACTAKETIEGDDSPPQRVFTNDIYPPAVPSGLQAVFSGPGQVPFVDLLWAANTDAGLAGYNIYRREEDTPAANAQPVKINAELVKTPAFRDTHVTAGKTYIYSVSAVDERGNESSRSEEASETVP